MPKLSNKLLDNYPSGTTWRRSNRRFDNNSGQTMGPIDFLINALYSSMCGFHSFARFNLNAFTITDTELKLIAAAAMMGESSSPKNGYSTPAAIGIPSTL